MSLRQRYGTPVALAIVAALVVKALILYGLWYTFIAPPHTRHAQTPATKVEQHPPAPSPSNASRRE